MNAAVQRWIGRRICRIFGHSLKRMAYYCDTPGLVYGCRRCGRYTEIR